MTSDTNSLLVTGGSSASKTIISSVSVVVVHAQEHLRRGTQDVMHLVSAGLTSLFGEGGNESDAHKLIAGTVLTVTTLVGVAFSVRWAFSHQRRSSVKSIDPSRFTVPDDESSKSDRPSARRAVGWLSWLPGLSRHTTSDEIVFVDPVAASFAQHKREMDRLQLAPFRSTLEEIRTLVSALEVQRQMEEASPPPHRLGRRQLAATQQDQLQRRKEAVVRLQRQLLEAGEQLTQYMVKVDELPVTDARGGRHNDLLRERKALVAESNEWAKELDRYHATYIASPY